MPRIFNIFTLARVVFYDLLKEKHPEENNKIHIERAIKWLCRAQDSTGDGGVSEGFHLYHGWLPSYPETTGYIIETFFDYYHYFNSDVDIKNRAICMADWLVSIQNVDGSIPDSYYRNKMVFDTGQVIFGFIRAYEETFDEKYKEAAIRAADWIVNKQEQDGTWIQHSVDNIPHTYYSRVAWSLLKTFNITLKNSYKEACIRNIEWCLQQQDEDGWFNKASFNQINHHKPFTHTIAYTLRGILESGIYLGNKTYIEVVKKTLDNLIGHVREDGFVCGTYGKGWEGNHAYTCLTGNAQLAIIFNKLFMTERDEKYHLVALKINKYLKRRQENCASNQNVLGAIAGSYPIWGEYIHYCYPNWAAKFIAESLIIETMIMKKKHMSRNNIISEKLCEKDGESV